MTPTPRPWPLSFHLYRALTGGLSGHLGRTAARRHAAMGAAPGRLRERLGQATLPRPEGPLVWINAASLGEVRAASTIVAALGDTPILLTTTSQTGADRALSEWPPTTQHQFTPLDTNQAMTAFLTHWHPDLAIFIESEVPMRAVDMLEMRGTPMAWLNVRPSQTRARFPKLFAAAMDRMAFVSAQDPATAAELRRLGLRDAQDGGTIDLKALAPPPRVDAVAAEALQTDLAGRAVCLALSIHLSEASILSRAWSAVMEARPDACLIVAPRYPDDGPDIARAFDRWSVRWRSRSEPATSPIYLADTMGEVGTLLSLASFAIIGGTLADEGGHSPAEALAHHRPVIHGPHEGPHSAAFSVSGAQGAARVVRDADQLSVAILEWLDPAKRAAADAAVHALASKRGAPLERLRQDLLGLLK